MFKESLWHLDGEQAEGRAKAQSQLEESSQEMITALTMVVAVEMLRSGQIPNIVGFEDRGDDFRCGIKRERGVEDTSRVTYWKNSLAITEKGKALGL